VFKYHDIKITQNTRLLDFKNADETSLNIKNNQFSFAITVDKGGVPFYIDPAYGSLSLSILEVNLTDDSDNAKWTNVTLEPCPDEFYENSSNQTIFNKNYLCPVMDNLELYGNIFRRERKTLSIQILKCYSGAP